MQLWDLSGDAASRHHVISASRRVLVRVHDQLAAAGLTWDVNASGAGALHDAPLCGPERFVAADAEYVDDLLLPVAGDSLSIVARIKRTGEIAAEAF